MAASLTIPDFCFYMQILFVIMGAALHKSQNTTEGGKFCAALSLAVCFNKPHGSANHRGENKGYVTALLGRYSNYASVSFAV